MSDDDVTPNDFGMINQSNTEPVSSTSLINILRVE